MFYCFTAHVLVKENIDSSVILTRVLTLHTFHMVTNATFAQFFFELGGAGTANSTFFINTVINNSQEYSLVQN